MNECSGICVGVDGDGNCLVNAVAVHRYRYYKTNINGIEINLSHPERADIVKYTVAEKENGNFETLHDPESFYAEFIY